MGNLALYRKYRSGSFEELVGQDHVATVLANALQNGRISHAYLFTGPRGVGKTSVARILAREVNGGEATQDDVDIIEIDAASNNGVDEIRELREKVYIAPNFSEYKVYIIDEVHMLSQAAFNALLKTLEEPPGHVIFILATTEPHKLPATIVSRTQHFPFRPIPANTITQHLSTIAEQEKIQITDDALQLLARLGEGSLRDSISLLDQVATASDGTIEITTVEELLGMPKQQRLLDLITAIADRDQTAVITSFDGLLDSGVAPQQLLKQLLQSARNYNRQHLKENTDMVRAARQLTHQLSQLSTTSPHLEIALEATLLQLAHTNQNPKKPAAAFKDQIAAPAQKPTSQKAPKSPQNRTKPKAKVRTSVQSAKSTRTSQNAAWVKALSHIKQRNNSLYAILRSCSVDCGDEKCNIIVDFQFHLRRLEEGRNRNLIVHALEQAYGKPVAISFKLSGSKQPDQTVSGEAPDQDALSQVMQILGEEVV